MSLNNVSYKKGWRLRRMKEDYSLMLVKYMMIKAYDKLLSLIMCNIPLVGSAHNCSTACVHVAN